MIVEVWKDEGEDLPDKKGSVEEMISANHGEPVRPLFKLHKSRRERRKPLAAAEKGRGKEDKK